MFFPLAFGFLASSKGASPLFLTKAKSFSFSFFYFPYKNNYKENLISPVVLNILISPIT